MKIFTYFTAALVLAGSAAASISDVCEYLNSGWSDKRSSHYVSYACPIAQAPFIACTRILLNDCLLNQNGVLKPLRRGNAGWSCQHRFEYTFETTNFTGFCLDERGGMVTSAVRLDAFMNIDSGNLDCMGIKGRIGGYDGECM